MAALPKGRGPESYQSFHGCKSGSSYWLGEDFRSASLFRKPPEVTARHEGSSGEGDWGWGRPCLCVKLVLEGRQAGRKEPGGLGRTRKEKPPQGPGEPLGPASPEALYANSKSWGAAARKPWPSLSSSERKKKKVRKWVALRGLL